MEKIIAPQWAMLLEEEMAQDYFRQLWHFVESEYAEHTCYPPAQKIFAALNACPLQKVKAVIIGQDPYHEEGQAEGLSFSFAQGLDERDIFGQPVASAPALNPKKWPPSLKNILKEVSADTLAPQPQDGSLRRWAEQGVLLLNATLTVRQGQANSHANHGWERFTDAVIRLVATRADHVVFFLWGSYAQKKKPLIPADRHLVIESAHPSPLSAHRGFFGSRQFSRANKYLREHHIKEIVW